MDWHKTIMEGIKVGDTIKVIKILIPANDADIIANLSDIHVGKEYVVKQVLKHAEHGEEYQCDGPGMNFIKDEVVKV